MSSSSKATAALFPEVENNRTHLALLVLRLAAGSAMILHGLPKIQAPFSWMGPDAAMPGVLQALAALSEFGGGIAWILGALTPLASLGILSTMVVATSTHVLRGDAFVGKGGSFELPLLFLSVALVLLVAGPGRLSVDRWLRRRVSAPRQADAPSPLKNERPSIPAQA